jgi:hypothetical protein
VRERIFFIETKHLLCFVWLAMTMVAVARMEVFVNQLLIRTVVPLPSGLTTLYH